MDKFVPQTDVKVNNSVSEIEEPTQPTVVTPKN